MNNYLTIIAVGSVKGFNNLKPDLFFLLKIQYSKYGISYQKVNNLSFNFEIALSKKKSSFLFPCEN